MQSCVGSTSLVTVSEIAWAIMTFNHLQSSIVHVKQIGIESFFFNIIGVLMNGYLPKHSYMWNPCVFWKMGEFRTNDGL